MASWAGSCSATSRRAARSRTLSGGEKARLQLACLMLAAPTACCWTSRPTTSTSPAPRCWSAPWPTIAGTVIVISHDRYFLDQVVDRIWEIERRSPARVRWRLERLRRPDGEAALKSGGWYNIATAISISRFQMIEQDDAPRRAEPIDRLRDDVRVLGHAVGEVLREQGGAALLEAVEHVRTEAIAVRSPGEIDSRREDDLLRYVEAQSTSDLLLLVRAFQRLLPPHQPGRAAPPRAHLRERGRARGGAAARVDPAAVRRLLTRRALLPARCLGFGRLAGAPRFHRPPLRGPPPHPAAPPGAASAA